MSTGAKSAEGRFLVALLLFTCFVLMARAAKPKPTPTPPEPPVTEDDTQPVRPLRRSMEERERAAQRGLDDACELERRYPPVIVVEE